MLHQQVNELLSAFVEVVVLYGKRRYEERPEGILLEFVCQFPGHDVPSEIPRTVDHVAGSFDDGRWCGEETTSESSLPSLLLLLRCQWLALPCICLFEEIPWIVYSRYFERHVSTIFIRVDFRIGIIEGVTGLPFIAAMQVDVKFFP